MTEIIQEKIESLDLHHKSEELHVSVQSASSVVEQKLEEVADKGQEVINTIKDALHKEKPSNEAAELEQKLKPYEPIVEKAEAVLLWRNPIGLAAIVVLVNLLFVIIYKFELTFLPTLCLILLTKCLIELVWTVSGPQVEAILFPQVEKGGANEPNRIRSLDDVCEFVAPAYKCVKGLRSKAKPSAGLSTQTMITIGVLLGLVIFFSLTGTFWLSFIVINGILLLPGLLTFPPVNEKVVEVMKSIKKKAD